MKTMSKDNVIDLTKQICKAWEINKMPIIEFLEYEYMETTLAMIFLNDKTYRNNLKLKNNLIVFNKILLYYPFDKIIQVIYHELAHLITGKGDDDFEFELFCKLNKIPLMNEWEEEEIA